MVSFEEWKKIDLRIAKIVSVESIEGKDKLYRLEIEIGEEKPRTLVAGIKQFYSKEDLIGRQIVVVANLEPKPLAGILSHGMLLAVLDKNKKFALLTVESGIEPGAKVE